MGLSPVSVVSHCEQVTPPNTPWVRGNSRDAFPVAPSLGGSSPDASARLGAWHTPLSRKRPLPICPCLAPSSPSVAGRRWLRSPPCGEFEQGFLDRHGPAQVGLSPPFKDRPHRLKTEPTTPAVHASRDASLRSGARVSKPTLRSEDCALRLTKKSRRFVGASQHRVPAIRAGLGFERGVVIDIVALAADFRPDEPIGAETHVAAREEYILPFAMIDRDRAAVEPFRASAKMGN